MVLNVTLPPARPESWLARLMMSQLESKLTERSTAVDSLESLDGFVSVSEDRSLDTREAVKACWRAMRSRSPRGRSWRWRTKARP